MLTQVLPPVSLHCRLSVYAFHKTQRFSNTNTFRSIALDACGYAVVGCSRLFHASLVSLTGLNKRETPGTTNTHICRGTMVESTFARYSYLADDDSTLHYSSDESASLSDAYFQPASLSDSYFHPAAARGVSPPMTYSPEDSYHKGADDCLPQLPQFPLPKYGSFSSQSNHGFADKLSDRSVCSEESPLNFFYKHELSRSIQEEYPQQILNSNSQDDEEQQQQQPQRYTSKQMSRQERRRYQRYVRMEHQVRELKVRQVRGKSQGESRQDSIWVMVLFLLQLALILGCAVMWGSTVLRFRTGGYTLRPRMLAGDDDVIAAEAFNLAEESKERPLSVDCWAVLSMCAICGIYGCVLSTLTVGFMLIIGKSLIQTALVFSILLALSWGLIGMSIQPFLVVIPTLGFVSLLLTLSYTLWVVSSQYTIRIIQLFSPDSLLLLTNYSGVVGSHPVCRHEFVCGPVCHEVHCRRYAHGDDHDVGEFGVVSLVGYGPDWH